MNAPARLKPILFLSLGAAVAAVLALSQPQPALANNTVLCGPQAAGTAPGPRRVTNPNTSTSYNLNSRGCAAFVAADVSWAMSQGYTPGPNLFTLVVPQILANTTAANSPTLPAAAYIHNIVVHETSAAAVTGGLDIGTAASGAEIVSALTVSASTLNVVADTALLKRVFSATVPQQIFFTCRTNCNSGPALNVTIIYSLF